MDDLRAVTDAGIGHRARSDLQVVDSVPEGPRLGLTTMRVGLIAATIQDSDGEVAITRAKERSLLCLLGLHAGRIVSVDRLIDGLWGDEPPRTASKTLQTYVKNLRSRFAEAGAPRDILRTEPPGYRLLVDESDVDVLRFEQLSAEGDDLLAAGDVAAAEAHYDHALSLLGDGELELLDAPSLDGVRIRLTELRRHTRDQRHEALLGLGRHRELIAPLAQLTEDEPQNETAWAQLMLSLVRSDRQRDALNVVEHARARLIDEFGLEPGPALAELEHRILVQDPDLLLPGQSAIDAPDAPQAVVLLEVTAADGTPEGASRLIDLTVDPGSWKERMRTESGERIAFPNTDAANLAVGRLRRRDPACFVTIIEGSAVPVGSVQPIASRVPTPLIRHLDRSPATIPRGIEGLLAPRLPRVAAGDVRIGRVVGAAGMGKTVALAEMAEVATQRGAIALYSCARESDGAHAALATIAYQATLVLDQRELEDHGHRHGHALGPLVPELVSRLGRGPTRASTPPEIEQAFCDLIGRVARQRPLLLLIDDAPLLDDASARVIDRLASDPRQSSMLIVLASRSHDPSMQLDAQLEDRCVRDGFTHELEPFSVDETARYLEAVAGIDRTPRTNVAAELIHASTNGLPLFVREIAHDVIGDDAWMTERGTWRIDRTDNAIPLPSNLADLLDRRLDRLASDVSDLVGVVAVLGDSFDTLLIAHVSELPVADVLAAIDELISHRILEPWDAMSDHYRFHHPLLREAALRRTGPGRRATVAFGAAEYLSNQPSPGPEAGDRLADLWFRARPLATPEQVIEQLERAADAARSRGDHHNERRHLQRMVEVRSAAGLEADPLTAVQLAEAWAAGHGEAGQRRRHSRQAFELATRDAHATLAARSALAFAGPFNPYGSLVANDAEAADMAETALAMSPDAASLRIGLLGMVAAARSDTQGAAPEIHLAVEQAEATGDPALIGPTLSLYHALESAADGVDARLARDERILDIARSLDDRHLELQGWSWVAAHAFEAGDIDRFETAAGRRTDLAHALGDRIYRWNDMVHGALRAMLSGRFDVAERRAWAALEEGRLPLGEHANRFFGLQLLKIAELRGQGAAMLGPAEEAAAQLDYLAADVALAHLCAESELPERAAAILVDALPHNLSDLPRTYDRLPVLAQLARLSTLLDDAALAARVEHELRPHRGQLCAIVDAVLYSAVDHALARCAYAQRDNARAVELLNAARPLYERLDATAFVVQLDHERALVRRSLGETGADDELTAAASAANARGLHLVTPHLLQRST